MSIGQRIKKRREELGMSQEDLARKAGYKSRSSINKIEVDGRGLPQGKMLALANALDTTPSYLMGWDMVEAVINEELARVDTVTRHYIQVIEDNGYTIKLGDTDVEITDKNKNVQIVSRKAFMTMIHYCDTDINNNVEKLLRNYT